ncbi:hypothetical protein ACFE04_003908 [Oxalis oulophora]
MNVSPLRMVKPRDQEYDNSPFELSDSCHPRKRSRTLKIDEGQSSSRRSRVENPLPALVLPSKEISTTLSLYDESWIANNKILVESSAKNYAASGERTRFLKEAFQLQQRERATEILISSIQDDVLRRNGDGPENQELSTGLSLFDQSWITNNPALAEASLQIYSASKNITKLSKQEMEEELKQREVVARISLMKHYTTKDEDEEKKLGLSTKLALAYPHPFKITKTLTRSDLYNLCRLLIGESLIHNYVFPSWSAKDVNKVRRKVGLKVDVWDENTNSQHTLVLKLWGKWKGYVFIGRWRPDFVVRRGLSVGDKIGLYWDQSNKRFTFTVLQRAAATAI